VKAAVSRLPFSPRAEDIEVDVESALLRFTTQPGTTFSAEELRRAVRDAGFDTGAVTVDGEPLPASD
jgi:hypothetical protein